MLTNLNLPDYLIKNKKVESYFNEKSVQKWTDRYKFASSEKHVAHDEPWLTLIGAYALFGSDTRAIDKKSTIAFNEVLGQSGLLNPPVLESITRAEVENDLKEVTSYNEYLQKKLTIDNFHLYPDRRDIINQKTKKKKASFEGNTQIDLMVTGRSKTREVVIFIEAKYLSDISYQITYNPVRDQIARNFDNGIDIMKEGRDFYFLLLTPSIFRTNLYGGSCKTILSSFGADRSRLYCYKMDEYRDPDMLKKALPHRNEPDIDWKTISGNIGWITFEDIYRAAIKHNLISDPDEKKMIGEFFGERNLI